MERFEDGALRNVLLMENHPRVEFRDVRGRLRGTMTAQEALETTRMRPTETVSALTGRNLPGIRFVGFGTRTRIHHITPAVTAMNLDWTQPAQGSVTRPK